MDFTFDLVAWKAIAGRGDNALLWPPPTAELVIDDHAVPAGVPVMIIIPGFSVKFIEKKWIRSAQVQIMFLVLLDWRSSPLIRVLISRVCGSSISSAVTIQGPIGALESKALPRPKIVPGETPRPAHLPVTGSYIVGDGISEYVLKRPL